VEKPPALPDGIADNGAVRARAVKVAPALIGARASNGAAVAEVSKWSEEAINQQVKKSASPPLVLAS